MGTSNVKVKESPVKSEKERKRSISKNLLRGIVNEAFPRQRRQKLDATNLSIRNNPTSISDQVVPLKSWLSFPRGKGHQATLPIAQPANWHLGTHLKTTSTNGVRTHNVGFPVRNKRP
ncbi:hypothetical protein PIB30_055303, partial [Stylosanthes scabra]|nr:hypothetical protein [Stylosanthes scabra]